MGSKKNSRLKWPTNYRISSSGCWIYLGCKKENGKGYGVISTGEHAHRAFYALHKGEIPKTLWVLHRCDNPPCVNPDHLFLGTHKDNMRDMAEKNRAWNPKAKALKSQTSCKNGHPFDEKNTYYRKDRPEKMGRICKACRGIRLKVYAEKR